MFRWFLWVVRWGDRGVGNGKDCRECRSRFGLLVSFFVYWFFLVLVERRGGFVNFRYGRVLERETNRKIFF